YTSVSTNITVLDSNVPFLTLTLSDSNVVEGTVFQATVTRDPVSTSPLSVQVTSSDPSQMSAPATVEIPANSPSYTFNVTAVQDTLVERTNHYTLTVSATGFTPAALSAAIIDDDIPNLAVTLASHTVSEGAGPNAVSGTVTRSFASSRDLLVALFSGNTTAALVPGSVVIHAGATSATFGISPVNNPIVDGTRMVAIGAQ